jgi:hypothetical protein
VGAATLERSVDALEYLLCFVLNLETAEAEDFDALGLHPRVAGLVFSSAFGRVVGLSVEFDHELGFVAVKIGGVGAKGMLAAELHAEALAVAEELPEKVLVA